jgi:hypothetical protein
VCACLLQAGAGIQITGSGTPQDPYLIAGTGGVNNSVQVLDTATVDMVATGSGTPGDPLQISANALVSLDELTDVEALAPTTGQVLAWDGTKWAPANPASAPPGSVSSGFGLQGDGSGGSPLAIRARTPAQWTTDGYTGTPSSVGSALYGSGTGNPAFGPPEHTNLLQTSSTTGTDISPPASPTQSAPQGLTSVTLNNTSARVMNYSMTGTVATIMTNSNAAVGVGDLFGEFLVNGVSQGTVRLLRLRTPGVADSIGQGHRPSMDLTGTLAAGASVTLGFQVRGSLAVSGAGILFTNIGTRIQAQAWTVR